MKTKSLVLYPDSALFRVAEPVTTFDLTLAKFLDEMAIMVKDLEARGLAANQLGKPLAAFVMRDTTSGEITECVNPVLTVSGKAEPMEEGCLSIPSLTHKVPRHTEGTLTFQDRWGVAQTLALKGELAHTAQHEMDHLAGKLYVQMLGKVKRDQIAQRMKKVGRIVKRLNKVADDVARRQAGEKKVSDNFAREMGLEVEA